MAARPERNCLAGAEPLDLMGRPPHGITQPDLRHGPGQTAWQAMLSMRSICCAPKLDIALALNARIFNRKHLLFRQCNLSRNRFAVVVQRGGPGDDVLVAGNDRRM